MHSLEVIIALNDNAARQARKSDKETVERVLADLKKGIETPAVLALKELTQPVTA